MVYISLDTSTQALSPFLTSILSTAIRDRLHLAHCSFSAPFPDSSRISSGINFVYKYIDYPLLYSPASWTREWQTLVLRIDPKRSWSAHFSLNLSLTLPSDVSVTLLQILISTRNGSTEALIRVSLKSPHSPKV